MARAIMAPVLKHMFQTLISNLPVSCQLITFSTPSAFKASLPEAGAPAAGAGQDPLIHAFDKIIMARRQNFAKFRLFYLRVR